MWDLRVANPFGRLSVRNMLAFVAAIVATSLAFILLAAPTTHAADITWKGDAIVYDGDQYQKAPDTAKGLPKGDSYVYIEPKNDSAGANAPDQKAHVITFEGKAEDAKSAKYAVYTFTPPDTFKNPTGAKTISSEKKGNDDKGSTCTIDGIGWLICPVTQFMANSVDWLYKNVLTRFLEVRPMEATTDNTLFNAWVIMRNIANVAFVMAFLIIIYSQVTSMGISNYGIKRMLPRLVVAAVLVNVSYWICAIAIDVSNILGHSLNDLLMGITKTMQKSGSNVSISWQDAAATVLSGGALGVAGLLAAGSVSGAIAMLLPLLVGVLLAAVVAVVVMAARQALVVILVIISPLAFVAYLLPNTEKYFDKWKDLLMTMLMLFPIFSVIFGGSQLAGTAIIQNADSLVMLLLGMAVQVMPLVFVPLLMKFSGSLLTRVGGITNDKTKGLVDQSRNLANSIQGSKRKKNLGRENATWRRNAMSRTLQAFDNGRRVREGKDKANESLADARWEKSRGAHKVHEANARADMIKNTATSLSEGHVEHLKRTDSGMRRLNQEAQAAATRAEMLKNVATTDAEEYAAGLKRTDADMQNLDLQARAGKLRVDMTNTKLETNWEQVKAGDITGVVKPENLSASALANYLQSRQAFADGVQETSRDAMLTTMRQDMAKRKQSANLSDAMLKDKTTQVEGQTILDYAGGIMGTTGANSALSKAITSERKEFGENVENTKQLMNHFDVSSGIKQKIALGDKIPVRKGDLEIVLDGKVAHTAEAAIEEQLNKGSYGEIKELILESGVQRDPITKEIIPGTEGKTFPYAGTISREIAKAGIPGKAPFFGSKIINEISQGKILHEEGLNKAILHHLGEGKLKAESVSAMDAGALADLFRVAQAPANFAGPSDNIDALNANAQQLRATVQEILNKDILRRNTTAKSQQNMQAFLERKTFDENGKIVEP